MLKYLYYLLCRAEGGRKVSRFVSHWLWWGCAACFRRMRPRCAHSSAQGDGVVLCFPQVIWFPPQPWLLLFLSPRLGSQAGSQSPVQGLQLDGTGTCAAATSDALCSSAKDTGTWMMKWGRWDLNFSTPGLWELWKFPEYHDSVGVFMQHSLILCQVHFISSEFLRLPGAGVCSHESDLGFRVHFPRHYEMRNTGLSRHCLPWRDLCRPCSFSITLLRKIFLLFYFNLVGL